MGFCLVGEIEEKDVLWSMISKKQPNQKFLSTKSRMAGRASRFAGRAAYEWTI